MFIADGVGSGAFERINPHGGWRFTSIGSGATFTTPTSYTLCNIAGTSTGVSGFTFNSLGRLTYTQTETRHLHGVFDFSFKHSTGSGQDCYFAIYKNGAILGSPNVEVVKTADSGNYQHVAMHFDDSASTNDYYECYLKVASGNIIVHQGYMFLMGMPHS